MVVFICRGDGQIVGSQKIAHHCHILRSGRKISVVLLQSQKVMIIRRSFLIHLSDQFIECRFVVLV